MKTLMEHNSDVFRRNGTALTDIECPNCGTELQYVDKRTQLCSNPPQTRVKCYGCGYITNVYML